jgi:hypothetical protein
MEDTMKYMLLICAGGEQATEPDSGQGLTIEEWLAEVGTKRLDGSELRSPKDATTVRARGDEVLLSDGPFAETREFIAGYDIIDVADLDEAIRIASRHPVARFGMVEVRPFVTD